MGAREIACRMLGHSWSIWRLSANAEYQWRYCMTCYAEETKPEPPAKAGRVMLTYIPARSTPAMHADRCALILSLDSLPCDCGLETATPSLENLLAEACKLIARYRKETPLGHQPHMISHKADEFVAKAREFIPAIERD